jgi:phage-related protein
MPSMAAKPDKPLVWLVDGWKSPPMGTAARRDAGFLLRQLQRGLKLSMPISRPMPSIGRRVHELRIEDGEKKKGWRIIYRTDTDAIIVVHWFEKKKQRTPRQDLVTSRGRLQDYDEVM